jgi:hypothetical protein
MKCASCDESWNNLLSAKTSTFVRTKENFESFNFLDSELSRLSIEDLEEFKSTVRFRREDIFDEEGNAITTKQGISTFSVEILVKKYSFTPDQIEKVAAIFGIGPERFWARYHYFGDTYPQPHCVSRPYYNCPW